MPGVRCTSCSRPVRPVVAVDIDGTLGDYHGHFHRFAEMYVARELPSEYAGDVPFNEYLGLEKRLYRDIKLAYRQGAQKRSMPIFTGAGPFMRRLRATDVEVWIATTRPYMRLDNVDPDTRFWLDLHTMPYDGMVYDKDKYQQLAGMIEVERIVAVVEDLPEQCAIASGLGMQVWQPARPSNGRARWGDGSRTFHRFEALEGYIEQELRRWSRDHANA